VSKALRLLTGCLLALFAAASPAAASTITWFASHEVETIHNQSIALATLTIGTPWSLEINFDPDAPARNIRGIPGCNQYPVSSSTLTLGPYTYNSSGGSILTQHGFPASACDAPVSLQGLVQFVMPAGESGDPGAWPLGFMSVFFDFHNGPADGSLPLTPTSLGRGYLFSPFGNGDYWRGLGRTEFQVVNQPTAVPEPATVTMFGAGLAALIARRQRRVQ
jgi:hypothetical protein